MGLFDVVWVDWQIIYVDDRLSIRFQDLSGVVSKSPLNDSCVCDVRITSIRVVHEHVVYYSYIETFLLSYS